MPVGLDVCSPEAVDKLLDACFEPDGDCSTWKTTYGDCAKCVFSPESAAVRGPFITRDNARPKVNQQGCLDSLAAGCGEAYEDATKCTHEACDQNPNCETAARSELASCRQAAMAGVCRPLLQRYADKCGQGAGINNNRICFPPSGDDAALRKYISWITLRACGPADH